MVMLDQPAICWPKHGEVWVRTGVQVTLLHSFIFVSTVQVRIVSFLHCSAVRQERGSLGGAFARFVRLWNFYACLQREGNVRLLALVSDMSSPLLARLGRMGPTAGSQTLPGFGTTRSSQWVLPTFPHLFNMRHYRVL